MLVYSFQVTLLNGLFVNKLKITGSIDKTNFFFLFVFPTEPLLCPSLFFFSLSLNKIAFFSLLRKKKNHTHTKHIIIFFLYFKICYLKHNTKYIFCIMNTLNTYFIALFKLQFSHQFKQ